MTEIDRLREENEELRHRLVLSAFARGKLVAALETALLWRAAAMGNLGEGFHTAFRKGVDGKGSHQVWLAIHAMTGDGYGEAVAWLRSSLDYGWEGRLAYADAALAEAKAEIDKIRPNDEAADGLRPSAASEIV